MHIKLILQRYAKQFFGDIPLKTGTVAHISKASIIKQTLIQLSWRIISFVVELCGDHLSFIEFANGDIFDYILCELTEKSRVWRIWGIKRGLQKLRRCPEK